MAVLHNEGKNLRFFLELVDREVFPIVPGQPRPPPNAARVLGTVGVEFYDRRDQSYWPFIRLPVIYIGGTEGEELIDSIRKVCSLQSTGFAFRGGAQGELALQIGRQDDGGLLVEVGLDLASYLLEASGKAGDPGKELALFRYYTTTAEVVTFADQIKQELERLPRRSVSE
jgi:hypothetical protein